jgi:UDP-N-acetylglucosamine transferase subunit ALG13
MTTASGSTARTTTAPLLLVTVGSDHHPFDRVVDWVDDYLEAADHAEVRYFCQHATAHPPRIGEHQAFLDHDELQRLLGEATAIVSHGGPGTLLESLRCGRVPIAVPRRQRLGEAVDDHQRAFCAFLAERQEAVLVDSAEALHQALDRVLAEPGEFEAPPRSWKAEHEETLQRFADVVAECRPARRTPRLTALRPRAARRARARDPVWWDTLGW